MTHRDQNGTLGITNHRRDQDGQDMLRQVEHIAIANSHEAAASAKMPRPPSQLSPEAPGDVV
jgi:hypothetical protein